MNRFQKRVSGGSHLDLGFAFGFSTGFSVSLFKGEGEAFK
jgi:hypothetical protein